MSFFTDILSGGGNLYHDVTPSWFRNLAPREIQPGGFNPGRDQLGIDLDGGLAAEQVRRARAAAAAQQDAAQAQFDQSANAPIPGLLGGGAQVPPGAIPGLLGGITPQQGQQIGPQQLGPTPPFQPQGPYGQQAMQLAGLLNRPFVPPNVPNVPTPNDPRIRPIPRVVK